MELRAKLFSDEFDGRLSVGYIVFRVCRAEVSVVSPELTIEMSEESAVNVFDSHTCVTGTKPRVRLKLGTTFWWPPSR